LTTSLSESLTINTEHSELHNSDLENSDFETEQLTIQFDGLKVSYADEYEEEIRDGDSEFDIDDEIELEMLNDVEFGRRLAEMVENQDKKDADWIPRVLRQVDHKCVSPIGYHSLSRLIWTLPSETDHIQEGSQHDEQIKVHPTMIPMSMAQSVIARCIWVFSLTINSQGCCQC
jgi:hypothetical protein